MAEMVAQEFERIADKAVVDDNYEQAVSLYTQAIDLDPRNSSLYVSRAAARIKLKEYIEAVEDAKKAVELNPKNSKALLRKGIASFHLEEYTTAKAAFEAGQALDAENSQLKSWIQKCDTKLKDEAGANKQNKAPATYSSKAPAPATHSSKPSSLPDGRATRTDARAPSQQKQVSAATVVPAVTPQQPLFRHEWYQTEGQTVVTIFAKNIKPDQLTVEFGEQILKVVITRPDEQPYFLQLRLFDRLKPSESKYTILGTKVEVRIAKMEPVQWKGLEYDPAHSSVQASKLAGSATKTVPKKSAKDWDKLEAEVKAAEKDEKLEGDAALNKLFQDIYKNADEDTRRAMNKSFVESNGTVLSTNWKEVGAKNVEGSPPKGMEMKKWEH